MFAHCGCKVWINTLLSYTMSQFMYQFLDLYNYIVKKWSTFYRNMRIPWDTNGISSIQGGNFKENHQHTVGMFTVMNILNDGYAIFDADDKLTFFNSAFKNLYKFTTATISYKTFLRKSDEILFLISSDDKSGLMENVIIFDKIKTFRNYHENPIGSIVVYHSSGRYIEITEQKLPKKSGTLSIHRDVTRYQRELEKWKFLANHDTLTGLPNRRRLGAVIGRVMKNLSENFGLILLDIDHFKSINDTYGHSFGDFALKIVSERLRNAIRTTEDLAVRYGGDEFAVIITELSNKSDLERRAELVRSKITANPIEFRGNIVPVNVSIGFAYYPTDGTTFRELFVRADGDMYEMKRNANR